MRQIGDRLHVLQRLRRVADHEVELDRRPAAAVDLARGIEQRFGRDRLVDHVPQPVRGSLGRKGEARPAPSLFQLVHQLGAERLDAQAGQTDRQLLVAVARHDLPHQLADPAVVGGTERKKADLLEAGVPHHRIDRGEHLVQRPLAHRPEHHARLAETAAARAPALDFDGRPVVDDVDEGHDEFGWRRREGGDDAFEDRDA